MAEKLIGAAVFGQSGGPTSVINASAYGVIRTALDTPEITNVYGMDHGIVGVLNDILYDMGKEDANELELLLNTPSSALGSCRYKLTSEEDLKKFMRPLKNTISVIFSITVATIQWIHAAKSVTI